MGWFDEQIKQRMQADDDALANAFASMADAITGNGKQKNLCQREKTKDAIAEILKYYHVEVPDLPEEIKDFNQQFVYLLRPSGIMTRGVDLKGTWYKNATGAFLAEAKNGYKVALIPRKMGGYAFYDYESGKTIVLNKETAKLLEPKAFCFYKPLPLKKLGISDLLLFISQTLSMKDYLFIGMITFFATMVSMLIPKLTQILFSSVIEAGSINFLLVVGSMMLSISITVIFINVIRTIFMTRITHKTNLAVDAASMMRTLSLPTSFFQQFSTGEISSRTQSMNSLCDMLSDSIFSVGLTSIFSLVYITQIFQFAPGLCIPAIVITLTTIFFSILITMIQMKIVEKKMTVSAKAFGVVYSLITGIQKLKLSGAEKRAFSKWANLYREEARLTYNPPTIIKLSGVITGAISSIGTLVLYYYAVKSNVSVPDYFAFNASYGMVSGAFIALSSIALTIANIRPIFNMVKPILETEPEVGQCKKVVTKLSGTIELNKVSFRYKDSMPMILDDISLKISQGQYIAIVGKTGCGKSTLMRLLLGFEATQKGAIYYDGNDISSLDFPSLRQRIGVVLQNSKLFFGDIFSNITISAPWLTLEEAWEAAEMAGIAEDIRNMPMGMHTMLSEGSGSISGGQAQRLMIARAIAPKPKILMLDEATSALDNVSQKKVTQSLASLKCTRIVIAHRLSTIQSCDRILMLEQGRIIEDGTYQELMDKNGSFAELVSRQLLG